MDELIIQNVVLRTIPDFEGYAISCNGEFLYSIPRVICLSDGRRKPLKGKFLSYGVQGHLYYVLYKKKKYCRIGAHVLVAKTWIGLPPFEGAWVLHKDDNPKNNHYSNLYYGTGKDNAKDRETHGHTVKGSRCHLSKLTEDAVIEIKRDLAIGKTRREIANERDLRYNVVRDIDIGYTWKHVILENGISRVVE